ncbi:AraC family transcriptional regulator [Amycolatopsis jejuensis]|uniref:AraC family transcriptional regulator n=1 Tax=Amycolatopsis jejuensis TaxID=330084 RepID=UPI000526352A|nr:AraC family transcriptional regulator [Amycolatopsis jejuensis]
MAETALPLAAHQLVRTEDVQEVRRSVGRVLCPHSLEVVGGRFSARHHSFHLSQVGLNYLDYGTEVRISVAEISTFFAVQMPLAGSAEVAQGRERVVASRATASVVSPARPMVTRWTAGSPRLIVWIDRTGLEQQVAALLGRPIRRPVSFALGMDLALAQPWVTLVRLFADDAERADGLLAQPLPAAQFQRLLMTQLLTSQPNNYSAALRGAAHAVAPRSVRRAVELMEEHAGEPITVEDVAEAVGLGVRALQAAFRKHLGTTPTAHLREIRLRRVHEALRAAEPAECTVTDVALRWGFAHLGRFSASYRQCYGELPSETLRR